MRKYTRTNGIILKRIKYKDSDKILTIYTKDLGKVSAKAKGVSKITSKKRSHLELMNLTELYLIKTKPGYLITQASLISSYENIKNNLEKINFGYFILETFDKLTEAENQNETLFNFLVKTLEIFNNSESQEILLILLDAYMIKALSLTGFYSNIKHQNLPDNMKKYLRFLKGNSYKDIFKPNKSYEKIVIENSFFYLKDLIEEVTEKAVKTKVLTA